MNLKFHLLLLSVCVVIITSAQSNYPGSTKTLDNSYFNEGFIIKNGDTISCRIYLLKRKANDDLYLHVIVKDIKDSIYIYTPREIEGYSVGDISMISHRSVTASDTDYFFIKLIERGPINLYQRAAVPGDNEFLYYFKKTGDHDLLFLAPYKQNYTYIQEKFKDGGMASRYRSQNEDQFRDVFSEYLKDCVGVSNKIRAKFYTMKDLEMIVKEYNACVKQ